MTATAVTHRHYGYELAPSIIAELCNADRATRGANVRLYRRSARVWGPDDVIDGGPDCYDDAEDLDEL